MKIDINPKKELFKWGPIEFKLFYGSIYIKAILIGTAKRYPWPMPPAVALAENGKLLFIVQQLPLSLVGLKFFRRYFLNLKNYKTHWKKWENWVAEYEAMSREFNQLDLKKLSDKDLYNKFKPLYDLNFHFWIVAHVPEISNWGGEYLLKKKLKNLYKNKADEYLEILSAPVKFSFFQQEELDLLSLASIKKKEEFKKALKNHANNYCWLLNSYGGNRILKPDYFVSKLKELLKEKNASQKIKEIKNTILNNKNRKKRLIKKLKLNKELILIAEQISESIWWQDLRKGYIWRMQYYWDKFLREIVKRTNWKFEELLWCRACEVLDIARGKKLDKKEILKRKKRYAVYTGGNKYKDFTDKKYINALNNKFRTSVSGNVREMKGLVVSKGKNILGKVKIISNPFKEGNKMKRGDILVAGMTSPEFIVVMRKAKAIITDHGGMTCHAAIVSRELKIPCIVNTKIATKVLKDGDLVEVDATKGIIKILKKS